MRLDDNPDARLFKKGDEQESRLAQLRHALGTPEREATGGDATERTVPEDATLGPDKNYDAWAVVKGLKACDRAVATRDGEQDQRGP